MCKDDITLGEEEIETICSDEQEEIWELEAEIEDLEYALDEAQDVLESIKVIVRRGIKELSRIKDDFEESYFYDEPPDPDAIDSLDDVIEELEKLLDIAL